MPRERLQATHKGTVCIGCYSNEDAVGKSVCGWKGRHLAVVCGCEGWLLTVVCGCQESYFKRIMQQSAIGHCRLLPAQKHTHRINFPHHHCLHLSRNSIRCGHVRKIAGSLSCIVGSHDSVRVGGGWLQVAVFIPQLLLLSSHQHFFLFLFLFFISSLHFCISLLSLFPLYHISLQHSIHACWSFPRDQH